MANTKEVVESVSEVVNVIANCGSKVTCEPNINNEEALTFKVDKGNDKKVRITVKTDSTVRIVFNKELMVGKKLVKVPGTVESRPGFLGLVYGYVEAEESREKVRNGKIKQTDLTNDLMQIVL